MPQTTPTWIYRTRPTGPITGETFSLEDTPLPEPAEGEVEVATRYLSLDATNRVWLTEGALYTDNVQIGGPMRGVLLGEVTKSRHPQFPEGTHLSGIGPWAARFVTDGKGFAPFPLPKGADMAEAFAILSVAGPTAHLGLLKIGGLQAGEVVSISGAAGSVGIMAGQIARAHGAHPIGIAGTDEKCAALVDHYGYAAAINYKTEDVAKALRAHAPKGIDLHFENVGGPVLDAALANMKDFARLTICGLISAYNATDPVPGPYRFGEIVNRRLTIRGFIILDHLADFPAITQDLARWMADGTLRMPTHVVDGLDKAPEALNLLFEGANTGKLLVRL
ncbi:NADP-dependent oxidoreductase [Aestuariibius sp. 2305UL40-4]|uniref:NADP-dependent oxidoreductase n=1 Tax=Aestuariibius violaceus TaxID=3234132 RepID=UPI00345EDFD4